MNQFDDPDHPSEPEIANSFELALKDLDGGDRKYCVLKIGTDRGEMEFIFVPEEIHVLGKMCERMVEGIELREDYKPKTISVDNPKEMFPDI